MSFAMFGQFLDEFCIALQAEEKEPREGAKQEGGEPAPVQGSPVQALKRIREGSPGAEAICDAFAVAGALADDLVPDSSEQVSMPSLYSSHFWSQLFLSDVIAYMKTFIASVSTTKHLLLLSRARTTFSRKCSW